MHQRGYAVKRNLREAHIQMLSVGGLGRVNGAYLALVVLPVPGGPSNKTALGLLSL